MQHSTRVIERSAEPRPRRLAIGDTGRWRPGPSERRGNATVKGRSAPTQPRNPASRDHFVRTRQPYGDLIPFTVRASPNGHVSESKIFSRSEVAHSGAAHAIQLQDWPNGLGLGNYSKVFVENDVDLRALPHLNGPELQELRVHTPDHTPEPEETPASNGRPHKIDNGHHSWLRPEL